VVASLSGTLSAGRLLAQACQETTLEQCEELAAASTRAEVEAAAVLQEAEAAAALAPAAESTAKVPFIDIPW